MTTVRVFAPAKINLTLHVTGRRKDGYHELDSLVAFAGIGDTVTITEASVRSLDIKGPERQGVPSDVSNSVVQIAASFWHDSPLAITVEKNLPTMAGVGGGSADAAACYRAIARLASLRTGQLPEAVADPKSLSILARLGADIPMCVLSMPARVQGIGDRVMPIEYFPFLPAVLVNPRIPVPTDSVFEAVECKSNTRMAELLPTFKDVTEICDWLGQQRNDLQGPACSIAPGIAQALDTLEQSKSALFHRISGSGATCFGLYPTAATAADAAAAISAAHPDWWVQATTLGDQSDAVDPRLS